MKNSFLIISFAALFLISCDQKQSPLGSPSPASQPYKWITATKSGEGNDLSPDPLFAWEWEVTHADEELQIYTLLPEKVSTNHHQSFAQIQSLLSGKKGRARVTAPGDITFDFGRVNAAWLEFDSEDFNGTVEMSISEYNESAILNEGADYPRKTRQPIKYGNTYRLELNDELYEGVRYGWIHVKSLDKPWHIDEVRLVCQMKPSNYQGSFFCNDSIFSKIWYTGAYTVRLNLLKDHLGAILMERGDRHSWTGDAYPAQAASLVAFGYYDFVKLNLKHTSGQDNSIKSYSLYWILSLYDYFMYTGDTITLKKYIANATKKLDLAYAHYGKDPWQVFYGWDERLGAGFENANIEEVQNAYKMLSINAWFKFSEIMQHIGETELALKYQQYATEKIEHLRQNSKWFDEYGVHAAAEAVNAGFPNEAERKGLSDKFNNRLHNISYSPFNQYFIINALAELGRYNDAITAIKDCWGGQIEYGGSTFFEVYRPSWNNVLGYNDAPPNNQCGYTSLCHPWGAGVVKWLSEELLGIQPLEPGFSELLIAPRPCQNITKLKGGVPTPIGTVSVDIDIDKGLYEVSVPAGTKATIAIPKAEKEIKKIRMNGKEFWNKGTISNTSFINKINEDKEFIYIKDMHGGTYNFSIVYDGKRPEYTEKAMIYPAKFEGTDSITSGNFAGKYGNEGYVFFGYSKESEQLNDFRLLPEYVSKLTCSLNDAINWTTNSKDVRALAPDNNYPGSVGAIYTRNPKATLQTMTVDIETEPERAYQFALYFVDWEDAGRRSAIEIFDLDSKEIIAPVQVVRDYKDGKYLIYSYNQSVRIRINHVRGPNATLSGIFFDNPMK